MTPDLPAARGGTTRATIVELVGRDQDLVEGCDRLRSRSLVTITGPGGVGKTALAAAIADQVGDSFVGGLFVVDLTATDHPDGVAELVAIECGHGDFDTLVGSPPGQGALVVLDNCEHVLDSVADAAERLLHSAWGPTLLATSRAPLGIDGESVMPLAPLAVPFPGFADIDATTDSLRLLQLRAFDHGVPLASLDLADASELCRQLDGLPLAIELAAARLRSRSARELLADLSNRPQALPQRRARHPRHSGLVEIVESSSRSLDDVTHDFFISLSVFAGPFTSNMAAVLVGLEPLAAVDLLDELVTNSLITADTAGEHTRYRLLHPVRVVARQALQERGGFEEHQSRLVDLVINLVMNILDAPGGAWRNHNLRALLALYPHIAAALRWLLDQDDEPSERPLVLVKALWTVVHQRHTAEIAVLGARVLARWPESQQRHMSGAIATVATASHVLGRHRQALEYVEDALRVGPTSTASQALLVRAMALSHRSEGNLLESERLFREAIALTDSRAALGLALELRTDHGFVTAQLGDVAAGLAEMDEARADALEHGSPINATWALICRGLVMVNHEPPSAIVTLERAVDEARTSGYLAGIAVGLRGLALAKIRVGAESSAAATLLDLLDELAERGDIDDLGLALDVAAELAEAAGIEAWASLAATADTLPVRTASAPGNDAIFVRAAAAGGRVLDRSEAWMRCRVAMEAIVDEETTTISAGETATPSSVSAAFNQGLCSLTFNGETIVLRSSKGLRDLATLLAKPGQEVAAVDLIASKVEAASRQTMIDSEARRNLEQRIRDLQHDIDEAETNNDRGRVEYLEEELDTLVAHLSAAVGIGGRHRIITAEAERARSAVTHRIRAAIGKLESGHPSLGAHLWASVTTGAFCRYQPPTETIWTISMD